ICAGAAHRGRCQCPRNRWIQERPGVSKHSPVFTSSLGGGAERGAKLMPEMNDRPECWPELPRDSWKETYATLHMWSQIVGKVRLELTPLMNHWWNVPLYVSARGLTTSRIPYGERSFEVWFDFIRHQLLLETSDGVVKTMYLTPQTVADFYRDFMDML